MSIIETPRSQYGQIAELLRGRIEDGTYPPGSLLPSEDRLAEELGVSRVTVNQAVRLLRTSGHVKVRRGAGTTVRSLPMIVRNAQERHAARGEGSGAAEVEVRKRDLRSATVYREIGRTVAPPAVTAALGLPAGDPVLLRSRILYADDEPTQLADSYIPWSVAKDEPTLLREDTGRGGSQGRLAELGHPVLRFSEEVTVRVPTRGEQRLLEVEAAQPVFEIWHTAYTTGDRPIEVCVHVMPGHLWKLRYEWDDRIGTAH